MGCSFKFLFKEWIVNTPLVSLQSKNYNVKTHTTQKVRLDLNSWSVVCNPWCVHNRLFNANFEEKFKWTPDTNFELTDMMIL
jgi:hypothetical protein